MADIGFPVIELERSAWEAIQRGELTVDTTLAVHEGIAAFAEKAGLSRLDVEMGLKRAVRHAEPADA
ncbi:hypothetical protein FE633_17275 [Streptomyces montanus]|uniref:ANTAR domain-containing protein n=1 Tax=Streptomyces montanus TaxID=2580423 RepID=A0A5R9FQH1_9ACTN|nr:hypothetical protein [Streptomyces montanus]TLS44899.1 hypothetical protein FE633_17275 [Streptomyces montanus]